MVAAAAAAAAAADCCLAIFWARAALTSSFSLAGVSSPICWAWATVSVRGIGWGTLMAGGLATPPGPAPVGADPAAVEAAGAASTGVGTFSCAGPAAAGGVEPTLPLKTTRWEPLFFSTMLVVLVFVLVVVVVFELTAPAGEGAAVVVATPAGFS